MSVLGTQKKERFQVEGMHLAINTEEDEDICNFNFTNSPSNAKSAALPKEAEATPMKRLLPDIRESHSHHEASFFESEKSSKREPKAMRQYRSPPLGISSLLPPTEVKHPKHTMSTELPKAGLEPKISGSPSNKYLIGFPPNFKIENIYQ